MRIMQLKGTCTNENNAAERNVPFEYENAYEEWSTAGIGNAFLFGKVMTSNPNLLLELLQYSLPEFHIKQIENPVKEADIKLSFDAHGVRLDVITTDDQGRRIDVEMQMRDEKNIPRRSCSSRHLTRSMHMEITSIRFAIPARKTRTLYLMTESQRWF